MEIRRSYDRLISTMGFLIAIRRHLYIESGPRAPFQYPIRRLIVRSHKVSKPRYLYLELSDRSAIWQAPRQHCCRGACQISKRYEHFKTRSRALETLRDLTLRRLSLIGYWNGAQVIIWMEIRVQLRICGNIYPNSNHSSEFPNIIAHD